MESRERRQVLRMLALRISVAYHEPIIGGVGSPHRVVLDRAKEIDEQLRMWVQEG